MDSKTIYYRESFGKEEGLAGLMLVSDPYASLAGEADRLVLVVRDEVLPLEETELWQQGVLRVRVRRVTPDVLEQWAVSGDRDGVRWLMHGEVLSDPRGLLASLRGKLRTWPILLREQKLLSEFSRFVHAYKCAKRDLQHGQILDAYSHVLTALHHWAHVALVEQGMLPELSVWEQMRSVNPGIYKLFEELTTSPETLEQRVQLIVLACEFSMQTKMQTSCSLLLHLLGSREEPWTVAELQQDVRLIGLPLNLPLLLQKLMQRGLVKEVATNRSGRGMLKQELRYTSGESRH